MLAAPAWMTVGAVAGSPDILGGRAHWNWALLVPAVPAICYSLSGLFFPESPKHLFQTSRDEEAARKSAFFFMDLDEDSWDELKLDFQREMLLTQVVA